ncbi:general odorant-binding protein 19d-like [Planococcus citri]|uniref:general odorant-binding protein 19d-like n=1 Tax=Planococcus citri TaxID=170843 RepID=UPI0031F729CB
MNILVKVLIFACLTFSVASAEYSRQQRNAYAEECKKELNVTDEDFAILKSRDAPKNDAQSCLLECLYKKLGLVKDGKLDKDVHTTIAKAIYGEDKEKLSKMDEIYEKCSQEAFKNTGEKCSIGKNLRSCVGTNFKQYENLLKPQHSKPKAPQS